MILGCAGDPVIRTWRMPAPSHHLRNLAGRTGLARGTTNLAFKNTVDIGERAPPQPVHHLHRGRDGSNRNQRPNRLGNAPAAMPQTNTPSGGLPSASIIGDTRYARDQWEQGCRLAPDSVYGAESATSTSSLLGNPSLRPKQDQDRLRLALPPASPDVRAVKGGAALHPACGSQNPNGGHHFGTNNPLFRDRLSTFIQRRLKELAPHWEAANNGVKQHTTGIQRFSDNGKEACHPSPDTSGHETRIALPARTTLGQ